MKSNVPTQNYDFKSNEKKKILQYLIFCTVFYFKHRNKYIISNTPTAVQDQIIETTDYIIDANWVMVQIELHHLVDDIICPELGIDFTKINEKKFPEQIELKEKTFEILEIIDELIPKDILWA